MLEGSESLHDEHDVVDLFRAFSGIQIHQVRTPVSLEDVGKYYRALSEQDHDRLDARLVLTPGDRSHDEAPGSAKILRGDELSGDLELRGPGYVQDPMKS